jgi:hypothetical protein
MQTSWDGIKRDSEVSGIKKLMRTGDKGQAQTTAGERKRLARSLTLSLSLSLPLVPDPSQPKPTQYDQLNTSNHDGPLILQLHPIPIPFRLFGIL